MASHNDFGKLAENKAADYLLEKGYVILERNFRYLKAEIDIISTIDDKLVIVEVKGRKNDYFMEPQEAVSSSKRQLLLKAADAYVEKNNLDVEIRFDIIAILVNNKDEFSIQHIENAFTSIH